METKKAIRTRGGGLEVVRINRRRACRYMCLECVNWEDYTSCSGKMMDGGVCQLVAFHNMQIKQNASIRSRSIRGFCLDCMGGDSGAVTRCFSVYCPLHPYRQSAVDRTTLFELSTPDDVVLEMTKSGQRQSMGIVPQASQEQL